MIEVIDNYLPENYFRSLQDLILGNSFPWYWYPYVNVPDEERKHSQFTHGFFHYLQDNPWNSSYCKEIEDLIHSFKWEEILRVKANLIPQTATNIVSGFHVDDLNPHKVAIFYVNSSDGWTLFENGDRINCVENRIIFFDGSIKHSSVTSTNTQVRVVININYR